MGFKIPTGHTHWKWLRRAHSGTSAAYRFPSTTSMRSSAVESLRRVMSALWILYSARILLTVSPSSSVCAHWRETVSPRRAGCQSAQDSETVTKKYFTNRNKKNNRADGNCGVQQIRQKCWYLAGGRDNKSGFFHVSPKSNSLHFLKHFQGAFSRFCSTLQIC